jgi:hypothetical protein
MDFLKPYSDIIISLVIPIALVVLVFLSVDPISIYKKLSLDTIFLTVFGVILGLLITAYSIVLTTVPSMPIELLETSAYKRINSVFFYSILSNICFVLISIIALFITNSTIQVWVIRSQITISLFLTSILFLVVIYIRGLFIAYRKNMIDSNKK